MTTLPSSDRWLNESALNQLADDIAGRGYSIQPKALNESICAALLAEAQQLDRRHQLRAAGIGREAAELADIRGDRIVWLEHGLSPLTDRFLEWIEELRIHLNRHLYLGLVEYEGHLACYAPGAGYRKHLDRLRETDARMLTLIVYLNPDWTDEAGGQLRLYLQDETFLDVAPEAGTVVAFLSGDYWHEVLPGHRDRWAITGWFRQMPV